MASPMVDSSKDDLRSIELEEAELSFLANPDPVSIANAGMTGTASFMATALLRYIGSGSNFKAERTHTAVELKTKSTSYPKEIAGFDNKKFRLEFHALFSATSAKDLATKRKVAFQQESGTVEHRGQALAYAGIENLHNYVESKDDALASHLRMLWHFLKKCEPLQTVGVDQKSDADEVAYMLRVTGEAPVQAEAASVQPSEFSITFNHADLIETLETGLNIMGKQAAHAQST